jgi:hypothetical protein
MSDHHKHHVDKKHKKLAQILKNRLNQGLQQHADSAARERDLDREREEEKHRAASKSSRSAAQKAGDKKPVWSAKMQEIRDKNTGRKTMAKERWNRFAGTESGGGRGL